MLTPPVAFSLQGPRPARGTLDTGAGSHCRRAFGGTARLTAHRLRAAGLRTAVPDFTARAWVLERRSSFVSADPDPSGGQVSRRISTTAATVSRMAARTTKTPVSMPWNAQLAYPVQRSLTGWVLHP